MRKGEVVEMSGTGERIKNIRLELGLTMEAFGKLLDTNKSAVNNWEKGYNQPNKERLKKIAELGGISVVELLGGDVGMNENQKIVFEYLKRKSDYPITAVLTLEDDYIKPNEVQAAYERLSIAEEAFVLIALGNYVIQKGRVTG